MSLWLIGAGEMAQDYAKVLRALGQSFEVIGRGESTAIHFETSTRHAVRRGGIDSALSGSNAPTQAIVAVGINELQTTTSKLIEAGCRRLLVEKPGGLNTKELRVLHDQARESNAVVFIAYNRRFFAATSLARHLIEEDGGATSCAFEFTEWAHVVSALSTRSEIKASWFLANSTHVVDLVFHLCGVPKDWQAWHSGSLNWHPASARFCGAGVTDRDVFFSYHADWSAPGRWAIEIMTNKRRLIMRPMEQLHIMQLGSVKIESVVLDDGLEKDFKPGLYKQTYAFLEGDDNLLCSVGEQLEHSIIYDKMAGYETNKSNESESEP